MNNNFNNIYDLFIIYILLKSELEPAMIPTYSDQPTATDRQEPTHSN